MVDEDGHVLGALCVIDDQSRTISDRQRDALTSLAGQAVGHLSAIRSRLRLAELGDELARIVQREDDLVAAITHELRTPVTAIQGYLEVLGDQEELSAYRGVIEPITRNGQRLVSMVDHLLAGTRPEEATPNLHPALLDLNAVVDVAVAANQCLSAQREVAVAVHTGAFVPARADLLRLAHAVEQLIRNAVLFSPAKSAVTVTVSAHPRPTITITDAGVGIPADELPHVFTRFYRGHHARTRAVPGLGLGLSIARAIVTAHHGDITLTSAVDGTCAQVSLPRPRGND